MRHLTRNIYPGLICGIVIMILVGLPGSCFPTVKTFWEWLGPDKIVHLVMFGLQAFLIPFGYRSDYRQRDDAFRKKLLCLSLLVAAVYGGLTELLQKHVFTGRNGSLFDFYADVIGCVLGVFIFKMSYRKKIKKIAFSSIIFVIFAAFLNGIKIKKYGNKKITQSRS